MTLRGSQLASRIGRFGAVFAILLLLAGLAAVPLSNLAKGWAHDLEGRVATDFKRGQAELEAGKASLKSAGETSDAAKIKEALSHIQLARAAFIAARRNVDAIPLLATAAEAPVLSGALRPEQAVVELSRMGVALCDALQASAEVEQLLVNPGATPGTGGERLLGMLKAARPKLETINTDLGLAATSLHAVDPSVLPSSVRASVASAAQTIDKAIAGVAQLRKLIPVLLELLGGNGARTYLVEQVNPAELRAGGGFIGSYSILSIKNGTMALTKSGGIETVDYPRANIGQPGYIEPPKTSLEFYKEKGWVLGDSNFFPDFPANAKAAEMLAAKEITGVKFDGVISIDPDAVAYLLQVTGPFAVPDYGLTVQPSTFAEEVFRQQSAGSANFTTKKHFLSAVALELVGKLTTLPAQRWPSMVTALNQAATTRHFQVYFNNPDAEALMSNYGWSGTLNPIGARDFMAEIESNFGGSKSNHFLQRSYDVQLTLSGQTLRHKITVSMKNSTPAGLEGGNRAYRFYVRLYVPADATGLAPEGLKADDYPNMDRPPGLKLIDGWMQINVDYRVGFGTLTMKFEYNTSWDAASSASHSIYWQKQPGTGPDAIKVEWTAAGHTAVATGDLANDRVIVLTPGQVQITTAQAASAQIPSFNF